MEADLVVVVVWRQIVIVGVGRMGKEIERRWTRRGMTGRAGLRVGLVCGLKAFSAAESLELEDGRNRVRYRPHERLFYTLR